MRPRKGKPPYPPVTKAVHGMWSEAEARGCWYGREMANEIDKSLSLDGRDGSMGRGGSDSSGVGGVTAPGGHKIGRPTLLKVRDKEIIGVFFDPEILPRLRNLGYRHFNGPRIRINSSKGGSCGE